MPVKVKICGLTRTEDALAAALAGADFAGLVFHPDSPRHVSADRARAIAEKLRGRVHVVALFVNAEDQMLSQIIGAVKPDLVQLHGSEPPARVAAIRARFGISVMKAISISDPTDFNTVPDYETVADMLIFDGKPAAGLPGGRSCGFDWQLLRERTIRKPWLLAGGLNVQNVARAISTSGAQGVDVSSGIETSPGVKDAARIRDFVVAARAASSLVDPPA